MSPPWCGHRPQQGALLPPHAVPSSARTIRRDTETQICAQRPKIALNARPSPPRLSHKRHGLLRCSARPPVCQAQRCDAACSPLVRACGPLCSLSHPSRPPVAGTQLRSRAAAARAARPASMTVSAACVPLPVAALRSGDPHPKRTQPSSIRLALHARGPACVHQPRLHCSTCSRLPSPLFLLQQGDV